MSTVDKAIANKVIAGEYPEDNVKAIIRYNNVFNGGEAYKLVFGRYYSPEYMAELLFFTPTMENAKVYWQEEQ